MGYVIAGILGLFLAYLALWAVVAASMWIVLPVLVVALPVTVVVGLVVAVVVVVRTLAGVTGARPVTITPQAVRTETAGLPKPRGDQPFGRDPAWPNYLVGQWRVDLGTAHRAVVELLGNGFHGIGEFTNKPTARPVRIGCGIFLFLGWLTLSTGALAGAGILVALCWAVRTIGWLGWLSAAGLLRGGDFLIRRLRRAQASCQHCYYVSSYPAFPCDRCGRVHHDIRPGRLGGVWRRCECGHRLPTTVLGASARHLVATCQRCGRPLRPGSAVLTDIRLPLFGPVFAGKTRLMYAGLVALWAGVPDTGARMEFVDDDSECALVDGKDVINSGADTVKTPAGKLPDALTVRFTTANGNRALVHVFDAAGELFGDRDDTAELEFLDHAQGLVFVVDPFSLPWMRDELGETAPATFAAAATTAQQTESVYQVTVRRMRDFKVDTKRRGLAVAVVKADLLDGLPSAQRPRPDGVRDWLLLAGMDNLVHAAERDFGEVRYFLVASVPVAAAGPGRSPAAPFNWLISRVGPSLLPLEAATTEEVG